MTLPRDELLQLAMLPSSAWPSRLAELLPSDPAAAAQLLLWLHAERCYLDEEQRPPSLGALGDERYALITKLDAGASAAVWQAHDRKLGRNVAIKVFHQAGPKPGARTVLPVIAEARAACEVISEHVVRIHDVHGGPPPFIVMELVGEHDPEHGRLVLGTAATTCRPRSIAELARWLSQVARGVHDAHLRNVFHRDLKPHNILITPISRRARITDFGLAVSTDGSHGRPTHGPGVIRGTPAYMAPEQARGMPTDLDPRSADDRDRLVALDVWGLGALAHDLLTGRPPWHDPSGELEAWELAASGARPPRIERFVDGERVPGALRRIVAKALAMRAADRYASAAELADELDAFRAHRPTSLDRTPVVRGGLWCRRNPQLVAASLVTLVLVLLTLGASATVARLRGERDRLDAQVMSQRQHRERLNEQVARVRRMLAATQQELDLKITELSHLEATLSAGRGAHDALLASAGEALDALRQRLGELTRALPGTRRQRAARRPPPLRTVERPPPDPATTRERPRPDERARGVDD